MAGVQLQPKRCSIPVRAVGCKLDRTTGHDGRNGVLVNHLGDGVAQQHDILVKRLDLALQLDAIDEINGDWNMLAAELVQKRILQELAFVGAHDIFRVQ